MGKKISSSLPEDELIENGTDTVATTDGDFFKWVDDIIAEAFNKSSDEE